jgi:hypothetical protein
LQTDFYRLKEILKQRDALIEDSGLVLYTDNETKKNLAITAQAKTAPNGPSTTASDNEIKSVLPAALVAPETAKLLDLLGEGTIDDKLRKILSERQELKEHNSKLLVEIDEERAKTSNLEKKLIEKASKLQDNQEATQEIHDIQSNHLIFVVANCWSIHFYRFIYFFKGNSPKKLTN